VLAESANYGCVDDELLVGGKQVIPILVVLHLGQDRSGDAASCGLVLEVFLVHMPA
jgi:hypothetical protein